MAHISSEILYAVNCIQNETGGDFKVIKDISKTHLVVVSVALAACSAFGVAGGMKLVE